MIPTFPHVLREERRGAKRGDREKNKSERKGKEKKGGKAEEFGGIFQGRGGRAKEEKKSKTEELRRKSCRV